jgi:hypothetical protein
MISLIVRVALCLSCLVAAARVSGQTIAPTASSAPASSPPACPWHDPSLRSQELQVTYLVWKHNVVPRYALVHPSGAYGGVWLRDSFWTLTALGDPALSGRALSHFASRQRPGGQVPTQFTSFLRGPIYHADESTLLFLIWSAWQSQAGGPQPGQATLRRALSYIRSQAPDGLYRSMPGGYASWFDSFKLRQADTLSYNQGLYAVALLAAQALHLDVTSAEMARGIAGYRALAAKPGGYLRFSRRLAYHDISGLVGEYLSLWLFHRSLLDDRTVRATLATQTRFAGGFRVVEDTHGRYLPARAFLVRQPPGDYQNGGSWLLYDYLALAVGYLHHLPGMGQRMHQRLRAEFHQGATFHEYLNTNPHAWYYGREPRWRDGFSWDTHVVQVDTLLAHGCAAA